MATDELVQVSVPRRHLTAVYGFIAELEKSEAARTQEVEYEHDWTGDLVRRAYAESPKSMKRILSEMARHAGEELTTTDLARAMDSDATWNNVAGALGAFGRRVRSRYRMSDTPFSVRFDTDEGRAFYLMSEDVAAEIRDLAGIKVDGAE